MSKRTGSYATTTKIPWKKSTKINMIEKNQKNNTESIIHNIFEKCSCLTKDKFWISVFQNCARGKFPRYFYFKNSLLTYRKGNKTKRLQLKKSVTVAYINILAFFQEEAGILSKIDRQNRNKLAETSMLKKLNNKKLNWKDVKTDKLKDLLIMEFIYELCTKHNFDKIKQNELITTVKKGFIMKHFNNANILMKDNKINKITGLDYNKEDIKYEINQECFAKRPGRKVKGLGLDNISNKYVDFMEMWNIYLKKMEDKKKHKLNSYSNSYCDTDVSSEELSKSVSTS